MWLLKRFFKPVEQPSEGIHGIDWSKTLVAGSYALHALLKYSPLSSTWSPNDMDIMVAGNKNHRTAFEQYVASIISKNNANLIKVRVGEQPQRIGTKIDGAEDFHKDVFETITVEFGHMTIPVQFVGIHLNDGETLRDKLTAITDCPSSITYHLDKNGKRVFQIPEKVLESIFTGRVDGQTICPSRMDKYGARGFTYFNCGLHTDDGCSTGHGPWN